MSDEGAVWISPIHFFDIVAAMRQRAALRDGMAQLTAVDVAHAGGTSVRFPIWAACGPDYGLLAAQFQPAATAAGSLVADGESAGWPRHGTTVSRKVGTPTGTVLARCQVGAT